MPFAEDTSVEVRQLSDREWELLRRIRYEGTDRWFEAPVGMDTDFASVPRVFAWLLPRYGRYTKAAIVHDRLWREDVPAKLLDLRDADGIFRRAMRELGVPFLQRWVMWAAVRWGAVTKGGLLQADWWIELPRVLLVSVVVAPLVLPPAAVILVALGLFVVLETILWVLLWLGKVAGKVVPVGRSDKELVAPKLSWKL
jgi:uncharacterized protein DUF1353